MTRVIFQPILVKRAGLMQVIIIHKFRAPGNFAQGANENPVILFNRFAVRRARVIGILRGITSARRVNQPAAVQRKNNRVMSFGFVLVYVGQILRRHPRALVFDDIRPFGNILARKQTPAVNFTFLDKPVFALRSYWHNIIGSFTLIGSRM